MWDRPATLHRLADAMLMCALLLALYGAVHYALRLPSFALREVRLTHPVSLVSREQIELLIVREAHGNFFTVDLAALRAAFLKLPWVRNVSMRRLWPGRLEIRLEEHVPYARWGDTALVNTNGEVFSAAYDGELPVFIGPDDAAKEIAIQYEYFRTALAVIGRKPQQVLVSARRAWQIRLDDGTTLELGRESIEPRLGRFVANYQRTLRPLARRVDLVDLRYANGFAVRIPELRNEKSAPKGRKGIS
jgi:cell division protein FtsQ